MFSNPGRHEISYNTIKLVVGVIAISLAALTNYFSQTPLQSISASYHENGWSRDIFVGFLFAVSAFLLAYNGKSFLELVLSKIAAIAAMGVAMFPCKCVVHPEKIPHLHGISAVVMFVILAIFCYIFFRRAKKKGHGQALIRATIYATCGVFILAAILIVGVDRLLDGAISSKIVRLTFYGEAVALVSFGVAWLTASRFLPVITQKQERVSLSPFQSESQN
jgi:hypothetical protein